MKKQLFLVICLALLPLAASASDTLTLNLSAVLNNYPQTEGGYWDSTYRPGAIEAEPFVFAHTGDADGGGGMAYWEGFTLCTSGDTTNYGAEGSSDGWIQNQWGCMAGGGADSLGQAVPGTPYLVGYWGFYAEQLTPSYHSLQVRFTEAQAYQPIGVWICNHPWPYYGNINGDGFASAFSEDGDYFALVAHGLNARGEPTGSSARLVLASYSGGALHQSREWQYMDLRSLGAVYGLFFTMETSDTDALYGANTAVYFCLDRLSVTEAQTALDRPSGLRIIAAGEDYLTLTWSSTIGAAGYALSLNDSTVGTSTDTTFTFTQLSPYTSYELGVTALNATDTSDVAALTGMTTDETAPTMPQNLQAETEPYSISLRWQASEDMVGIKRYTVFVDGQAYQRTQTCSCSIVGLTPNTGYLIEVEAEDLAGNKSARASLRAHTRGNNIDIVPAEDETISFYTLDGRYVGQEQPTQSGIYIQRNKQKTTIIIY